MNKFKYLNVATAIVGWSIVGWIVGIALAAAIFIVGKINRELIPVVIFPIAFLVYFFCLRLAIPRALKKNHIFLIKRGEIIPPTGLFLIGMTWGLVWRTLVTSSTAEFLNKLIFESFDETDNPEIYVIKIFIYLSSFLLAALWLLNYPLGETSIIKSEEFQPKVEIIDKDLVELNDYKSVAAQTFSAGVGSTLLTAALIGYFTIGVVQVAAIVGFFNDYLNWRLVPSIIAAVLIGYIPVAGAVAGIFSAIKIWDWAWYSATLLFTFPLVLAIIGFSISGIWKTISER
jgi:hypothetical protein